MKKMARFLSSAGLEELCTAVITCSGYYMQEQEEAMARAGHKPHVSVPNENVTQMNSHHHQTACLEG